MRVLNHLGFEPAPKREKGSHLAFVKRQKIKPALLLFLTEMKFLVVHYSPSLTR